MIVIAGGSGQLGREVTRRLVDRGLAVRVLTRDPRLARAALAGSISADAFARIEIVEADVRSPATLRAPVAGADVVVSAIQGFGGREAGGLRAIDAQGNLALIRAAVDGGVGGFVLLSMQGAGPAAALALARAKGEAETALRATTLLWTIIRPSAYMETWAEIVGAPIVATGRARVFGRGRTPIDFVAAADVAAVVDQAVAARAVVDPSLGGRVLEVRGPEALTFDEVVSHFGTALGRSVPISHVPRPALRLLSTVMRPIRPVLADQIAAALIMDTVDLTGHGASSDTGRQTTTFDFVIRAYLERASASSLSVPSG